MLRLAAARAQQVQRPAISGLSSVATECHSYQGLQFIRRCFLSTWKPQSEVDMKKSHYVEDAYNSSEAPPISAEVDPIKLMFPHMPSPKTGFGKSMMALAATHNDAYPTTKESLVAIAKGASPLAKPNPVRSSILQTVPPPELAKAAAKEALYISSTVDLKDGKGRRVVPEAKLVGLRRDEDEEDPDMAKRLKPLSSSPVSGVGPGFPSPPPAVRELDPREQKVVPAVSVEEYAQLMPEIAGGMTPEEIRHADKMAIETGRSVVLDATARQPFDTVSKVMRERIKDLPLDLDEFFTALGEGRRPAAYLKYLKVVAAKGTVGHAVKAWRELLSTGFSPQEHAFTTYVTALTRPCLPEDEDVALKELRTDPPNPLKAAEYKSARIPEVVNDISPPQPHSLEQPRGTPEGVVTVAPRFATYGAKRMKFNHAVELAFKAFEEARALGIVPTLPLYSAVIRVCAEHKHVERAFALYCHMREQGIKPDRIIATHLMLACWKAGHYYDAEETMHSMWTYEGLQPDAPMYNLMIRICADATQVERAFYYYESMQHFGFSPSLITYTSLMHACVQRERPEFYPKAFETFVTCTAQGFHPNSHTFCTLLYACCERIDLHNASKVWSTLTSTHRYALNAACFEVFMRTIARSMCVQGRDEWGGAATIDGEPFSREDRIQMAERVLGIYVDSKIPLTERFFSELIGVYTQAAVGIIRHGRELAEKGDHDEHHAVTNEIKMQLMKRAWDRIKSLKETFPKEFKIIEQGYAYIFAMYGSADRLVEAFVHLKYMEEVVGIKPTLASFNVLMTWARINRDLDAGLYIVEEMKRLNLSIAQSDLDFLRHKDKGHAKSTIVKAPAFPLPYTNPRDPDTMFKNARNPKNLPGRNKKGRYKGQKPLHPDDYNASYTAY